MIKAHVNEDQSDWDLHLKKFAYALYPLWSPTVKKRSFSWTRKEILWSIYNKRQKRKWCRLVQRIWCRLVTWYKVLEKNEAKLIKSIKTGSKLTSGKTKAQIQNIVQAQKTQRQRTNHVDTIKIQHILAGRKYKQKKPIKPSMGTLPSIKIP